MNICDDYFDSLLGTLKPLKIQKIIAYEPPRV